MIFEQFDACLTSTFIIVINWVSVGSIRLVTQLSTLYFSFHQSCICLLTMGQLIQLSKFHEQFLSHFDWLLHNITNSVSANIFFKIVHL